MEIEPECDWTDVLRLHSFKAQFRPKLLRQRLFLNLFCSSFLAGHEILFEELTEQQKIILAMAGMYSCFDLSIHLAETLLESQKNG